MKVFVPPKSVVIPVLLLLATLAILVLFKDDMDSVTVHLLGWLVLVEWFACVLAVGYGFMKGWFSDFKAIYRKRAFVYLIFHLFIGIVALFVLGAVAWGIMKVILSLA